MQAKEESGVTQRTKQLQKLKHKLTEIWKPANPTIPTIPTIL
jgi:hypothetical protein